MNEEKAMVPFLTRRLFEAVVFCPALGPFSFSFFLFFSGGAVEMKRPLVQLAAIKCTSAPL